MAGAGAGADAAAAEAAAAADQGEAAAVVQTPQLAPAATFVSSCWTPFSPLYKTITQPLALLKWQRAWTVDVPPWLLCAQEGVHSETPFNLIPSSSTVGLPAVSVHAIAPVIQRFTLPLAAVGLGSQPGSQFWQAASQPDSQAGSKAGGQPARQTDMPSGSTARPGRQAAALVGIAGDVSWPWLCYRPHILQLLKGGARTA